MQYRPKFKSNKTFTTGVELEIQLIDLKSMDLVPMAPEILKNLSDDKNTFKPEFIQSMVEITTSVCNSMDEIRADLQKGLIRLEDTAAKLGCATHVSSLHPFALSGRQLLTEDQRYKKILGELQIIGRRMITQGLHVHVGMPDGETAIKVFDKIRIFLPFFLALSASSPYFEGVDTGLSSYRSKLFDALPRSGMPEPFGSWENFVNMADRLFKAEVIKSARDFWWDVRPHPLFGTIEIRICDLPGSFMEILALCAFIRKTVMSIATDRINITPAHRAIVKNNKWQAARYGLDGFFVDPETLENRPAKDAVLDLSEKLAPLYKESGSTELHAIITDMVEKGCTSKRQREIYKKHKNFNSLISEMKFGFWQHNGKNIKNQ